MLYLLFITQLDVEEMRSQIQVMNRARIGLLKTYLSKSDLVLSEEDVINPYPMKRDLVGISTCLKSLVVEIYTKYPLADWAIIYGFIPSEKPDLRDKEEVFYFMSGEQANYRRDWISSCWSPWKSVASKKNRNIVKVAESHRHLLLEYEI